MALTRNNFTGNGITTNYTIGWTYINVADVKVTINGTATTAFTVAGQVITFSTAPADQAAIVIFRDTNNDNMLAEFQAGSAIRAADLNENFKQTLFVTQESDATSVRAETNSVNAVNTANTAETNSVNAVNTANTAESTANTALATISDLVIYDGLNFVNDIPAPAAAEDNDRYEVQNSTGIESFSPLTGLPANFVGSSDLRVRIRYDAFGSTYVFVSYDAVDPENQYVRLDKVAKSDPITVTVNNQDVTYGITAATQSARGTMSAADKTKIDGIEAGATADQTAAEIRTLVDAASNSNVFTDADHAKLDGIEAGATGDQTASEIRTLVDAASDSNVFTDADHSKLDGIESGATADQTAAEIRTLVGSATDSNVFTDADHTKLDGIEAGATADQTAAEIRTLVNAASDSNVFTDADHTKLNGIESGATADQTKADIDALNIDADTLDGQHGSYYRNASNLNAGTISDARIPDTITPATLVQTKEIRTSNGTELVVNAGESNGKISGQTSEIVYVNAEGGLRVSTPSVSNWGTGYVEQRTNIKGNGIFFHHNTTAMGEITTSDTTWLRINQSTNKNIYTPRYIRADAGFFVDGTAKGINGSGNFIGGTISGASDYGSLLRSNASDQYDGQTSGRVMRFRCVDGRNAASTTGSLFPLEVFQNSNTTNSDAAMAFHIAGRFATYFGLDRQTNDLFTGGWSDGSVKHKIWHAGNDGSGSNLDADKLDAQHGSYYRNASNLNAGTVPDARLPASISSDITGTAANATNARIDHDTGNAWHRPVFIDDGKSSATNQRLKTDNASTIGFNPSTNQVRATTFVGGLSGNASTATTATNCSRSIGAGNGLTGGGTLTTNRTINVGAGSGISVSADAVAVDSSVVRTTGNQTVGGNKTFSGTTTTNGVLNVRGHIDLADNDILRLGSGDDAEFFVNGSHLYLDLNGGIGNFYIRDGTTNRYAFDDNGSLSLVNCYASGRFRAGNGSRTDAAYKFLDDNDTGMYRIGTNDMALVTGSQVRHRIQSSGQGLYCAQGGPTRGHIFKTSQSASNNRFIICGNRSSNTSDGSGGTEVFRVRTNGGVQNTANVYTSLSDERLKENIVDAQSQWDDVKALRLVNFNYRRSWPWTRKITWFYCSRS